MSQYVVMGVSGCGKSTIAEGLAARSGGQYYDADAFHPPANVEKMRAGIPLTDEDRWGWLDSLHDLLRAHDGQGKPLFLACSALKQVYRDRMRGNLADVIFVYLHGSRELIGRRMHARQGHFMPETLLNSQFATLEEPQDAVWVEIDQPVEAIIEDALGKLNLG